MTYDLYTLLSEYNKNRPLISEYLKTNKAIKENYNYQTFTASPLIAPSPVPSGGVPSHVVTPGGGIQPVHVVPGALPTDADKRIMGMAIGMFVTMLIFVLVLYIMAIVMLIKYWNNVETWVKVLSLVLLFLPGLHVPFTPVVVLLLIHFTKHE